MRQSQLRFDLKAWWRVPNMARKLSATVPPFVAASTHPPEVFCAVRKRINAQRIHGSVNRNQWMS